MAFPDFGEEGRQALFAQLLNKAEQKRDAGQNFDDSGYGFGSTDIAQGKIGSIPPTSVTNSGFSWLPGGLGASKLPYAAQEYGLYGRDSGGFAPSGVTLSGGRKGKNPGTGIKGVGGPQMEGYNTETEQYFRSPLDNFQLQLRKMGVPGM
jgi:hypothetical protein